MNRAFRLPSLITSIFLVGACQQLIGLGDYEAVTDDGEDGGASGTGGKAGSSAGGSSGKSATGGSGGSGGEAGDSTGGTGGRGGSGGGSGGSGTGGRGGTSGDAGEAGMGADGGTGGATGGSSGKGGSGGSGGSAGTGGSGGKSSCPELTLQEVVGMSVDPPDPTFRGTVFDVAIQQQLVGGAEDFLGIQFYAGANFDGDATGEFELGTGIDDNYESCGRCVLVERDASAIGNAGNTRFFATSGTLVIDEDSEQMDGRPILTLSDVTLVEVTIDPNTFISTPVQGGDCYHVSSYSLELPTPSWSCPVDSWGDNVCDCGCDAPDLECVTTGIGACDACTSPGSCAQTDCYDIDFDDNSQCSANNPDWNCPLETYGDGECTCGCGGTDPDCSSDYVGACDSCDEPGGCDATGAGVGDCATITLEDNSGCSGVQPWTCTPTYYYDGDCDCGCGVVDPDCSDETDLDCYCGTGSCADSSCTEIDPSDNSQCI